MFNSKTARDNIVRDLDALCDGLEFRGGAPVCRTTGRVSLRLEPLETSESRCVYWGSVFAGYPPPPAVEGIPWKLESDEGDAIAEGHTGSRGHFSVTIDADAVGQGLRLAFGGVPVVALKTRSQPVPAHVWRRSVGLSATVEMGSTAGAKLPEGDVWGLSNNGRLVLIEYPIDNPQGVDFPWGMARLEYRPQEGDVLYRLIPVSRNPQSGTFEGMIAVAELLPEGITRCQPGELYLFPVLDPASVELDELEQLQSSHPQVQYDPELRQRLQKLMDRLTNDKEQN